MPVFAVLCGALSTRVLVLCLGALAYALLDAGRFRHAVPCFALQALLLSTAPSVATRHPALHRLSPAQIWSAFDSPLVPCVYVIASLHYRDEYFGSTACWRDRLYQHARHVSVPGLRGSQFVHAYVRRFRYEYVFLPVALTGGGYLEERLIRTYSPALNRLGVPFDAGRRGSTHAAGRRPRRCPNPAGPGSGLCSFACHGVLYLQLFDALCATADAGGSALIRFSPASLWLDNTKVLLRCFGSCLVDCLQLPAVDAPLATVWQRLKRRSTAGPLWVSVRGVRKLHPFLHARAVLLGLLADPSYIREVYRMPMHTLITLMRAALRFTPIRSRHELCRMVNAAFVARCGHSLLRQPVVRVPWGLHQMRGGVSAAARQLLQTLPLPRCVTAWLQSRVRVVCARGRSVAALLHNHRAVAAAATRAELENACSDGFFLRCSAPALPPALHLLDVHSGLCPVSRFSFASALVCDELRALVASFCPALPPAATAVLARFEREAAVASSDACANLTPSYAAAGVPPLPVWIALRRALDASGFVCMPLDRDPYRNALCSKREYLARLRKLFIDDAVHYERCDHIPRAQIVRSWQALYAVRGWRRFGRFDRRGAIGYAYCFAKAKDVARSRVIVSCVKHPLRHILHAVGRALVYLLQRCAFPHYNLHSLAEFAARLATYAATAPESDLLLAVCTDVKEMYTGMRHPESLDAVAFVLERCRHSMRSPFVSVSTRAQGDVFAGRSAAKGFAVFHLDDLLQFVRFELENLYFSLGSQVTLRQIIGAAMGGFTSPGCAQAVASVAEYRCMRLFLRSGFLFAARYMDDTLCILNLSAMRRSRTPLRAVLHPAFHMYDAAGLEVELEAAGSSATVLSSAVDVSSGVSCVFWNKNADFAASGQQRVRRLQPCLAQSRASQRALMRGMLYRAAAATISASIPLLLPRLQQLRFELGALGYAGRMFDGCIRDFAFARAFEPTGPAWRRLFQSYARAGAADFRPP